MPRRWRKWSGDLGARGPESPCGWDPRAPSRRRQDRRALGSLCPGFGSIVLGNEAEHVSPSLGDAGPVFGVEETNGAVAQVDPGAARNLFQSDFHVVKRGIGHKHRSTQFEQRRRLDYLYVSPQMAHAIAAVAKPAPSRPLLEYQLHRFAF